MTSCTFPASLWQNLPHQLVLTCTQCPTQAFQRSSGKVFYHADALCASKHTSGRTRQLAGGRKHSPSAATCVTFRCRNPLCEAWLKQHRTWTACSTFERSTAESLGMVGVTRGQEKRRMPQRVMTLLQWLERKNIGRLQVPSSSCCHEQNVKLLLCTTFGMVKGALKSMAKEPSDDRAVARPSKIAPWQNGLHGSPSVRPVSEGHRLGERQEAVDTVRGRQGLA